MIRINKIQNKQEGFVKIIKSNLSEQIKNDDEFAKTVYASLCNTIWYNESTHNIYSCSWRYAGSIVAEIRNKNENYLDFYCSGGEGSYHPEVYKAFKKLGYKPIKDNECQYLQKYKFTGRL